MHFRFVRILLPMKFYFRCLWKFLNHFTQIWWLRGNSQSNATTSPVKIIIWSSLPKSILAWSREIVTFHTQGWVIFQTIVLADLWLFLLYLSSHIIARSFFTAFLEVLRSCCYETSSDYLANNENIRPTSTIRFDMKLQNEETASNMSKH